MGIGVPVSILGFIVSGDLGGETIYTDRYGRKIHFPKSPPKEPPTTLQVAHRSRFRTAQQEYMGLTPSQKQDYENLARACSLCMTGQNVFIHVAMMGTFDVLSTLEKQSGISVVAPTFVPYT